MGKRDNIVVESVSPDTLLAHQLNDLHLYYIGLYSIVTEVFSDASLLAQESKIPTLTLLLRNGKPAILHRNTKVCSKAAQYM